LIAWFLVAIAFADPADVLAPTGKIASVVVYPDRASITRVVAVPVQIGVNEIAFRDLPPTVDERSITAEASGVVGSTLLGLDVASRELAEDRRVRVSELSDQIEALSDEVRVHLDRRDAADIELRFLQELQAAAASQVSAELLFADQTAAHADALASLLGTRIPDAQQRKRDAEIEARAAEARLGALQRELSTVQGAAQWARRDVSVQVQSPAEGTAWVRLTYVLPGASWSPAYDARARPDDARVNLVLNALVVQTTGEDWSEVALSLSTARPSTGVSPPSLEPFWLQSAPVYGYPEARPAEAGAYEEYDQEISLDEAEREPPEPMAVATATVTERAVATTFEVQGPVSVPGDGTRRKLRVLEMNLDVAYVHVAVPRVEEAAFLVAQAPWAAPWPLLPGEVSAFLDDAFVGTMTVPRVGTGGDVELAFGRDDAVRVESEARVDMTSAVDWMGKITREQGWVWRVTNGRTTPVSLEVRDRVPQSGHARYGVRVTGDEPTETTSDSLYRWTRALAPGAATEVAFGYTIRYPRRAPPWGLE
jgi:uncharacterized protein (TIGR02231 family)